MLFFPLVMIRAVVAGRTFRSGIELEVASLVRCDGADAEGFADIIMLIKRMRGNKENSE